MYAVQEHKDPKLFQNDFDFSLTVYFHDFLKVFTQKLP
jgi:hypothetical protein